VVRYTCNMENRNWYYKKYAAQHRERKREIRRKSEARPEYKERRKEYMRKWAEENKDKIRANRKKWATRHATRKITKEAIKSGKLIKKPCEVCQNPRVEAHHPDYTKPFLIVWLCKKHHTLLRRK